MKTHKWWPLLALRLNRQFGHNAENLMHHPERWTFDWFYKRNNMDATDNRFYRTTDTEVEERAAELHEGCRMPMEQAREIAASEASPDWYARGQDWGLADALANGQSGEWVLDDIARAYAAGAAAKTTMKVEISSDSEMLRRAMAAETEAALLRAALDQKHAEYEDLKQTMRDQIRNATDARRGEIAYQLTKRLVIDMPTARAAVDAAMKP